MKGMSRPPVAVGVPRALLYHEFGPVWEEFLAVLGATAVTSGPTTRAKIERGLSAALDEVCLPVKVAYGHCLDLADRVEHVFIPRVVSVEPKAYSCPKLLGLPDLIRLALPQRVKVLSPLIDLSNGSPRSLVKAARQVAALTGAPRAQARRAAEVLASGTYYAGRGAWCGARRRRTGETGHIRTSARAAGEVPLALGAAAAPGATPIPGAAAADSTHGRPRIGLIGHSYNLMDDGLNLSLRDKLRSLGLSLVTAEDYTTAETDAGAQALLPKPLFWTLGRKLAGAATLMSREPAVEGMVAVASFGCGPDSMVLELVERLIRRSRADLPFMLLTLDEHTGEAGLKTRLEAFSDLVIRRRAG